MFIYSLCREHIAHPIIPSIAYYSSNLIMHLFYKFYTQSYLYNGVIVYMFVVMCFCGMLSRLTVVSKRIAKTERETNLTVCLLHE